MLEVKGGAGGFHSVGIPDVEFGETGKFSLAGCVLDRSRALALRAIEFHECTDEAHAIALAQVPQVFDTRGVEGTFIK